MKWLLLFPFSLLLSCGVQEVIALSTEPDGGSETEDASTQEKEDVGADRPMDAGIPEDASQMDASGPDAGTLQACTLRADSTITGVDQLRSSPPAIVGNEDEVGVLVHKTPFPEIHRLIAHPSIDSVPLVHQVFEDLPAMARTWDIAPLPNRNYRVIGSFYDQGGPFIAHETVSEANAIFATPAGTPPILSAAAGEQRAFVLWSTDSSLTLEVSDTSTTIAHQSPQIGRTLDGRVYPELNLAAYVQDWDFPPTVFVTQLDPATGAPTGQPMWGPMCGTVAFDVARYANRVFLLVQCETGLRLLSYDVATGQLADSLALDEMPAPDAAPRLAADGGGYLAVVTWADAEDHPRMRIHYASSLEPYLLTVELARAAGADRSLAVTAIPGQLGQWAAAHAAGETVYLTRLAGCPTP